MTVTKTNARSNLFGPRKVAVRSRIRSGSGFRWPETEDPADGATGRAAPRSILPEGATFIPAAGRSVTGSASTPLFSAIDSKEEFP